MRFNACGSVTAVREGQARRPDCAGVLGRAGGQDTVGKFCVLRLAASPNPGTGPPCGGIGQ